MHCPRIIRHRVYTLVLAASLGLSQTAWPHGSGGGGDPTEPSDVQLGCSVHSLRGAYVIQGSGAFVPPGSPLPFTLGAATPVHFQNLSIFDGQGHMTDVADQCRHRWRSHRTELPDGGHVHGASGLHR